MPELPTSVRAAALSLGHRVVMALLTRMRSSPGDRANALMRDYYAQRAPQGGLMISEATPMSRQSHGYAGATDHPAHSRIAARPSHSAAE